MNVKELLARPGEFQVVDVREQREWDAGHLPEAMHIPLDELSERALPAGEKPVVFLCRTGVRSLKAAERMSDRGVQSKNLDGGLAALVAEGVPLVDTEGAPGRLAEWDPDMEPEELAPDLAETRDSFLEVIFGLQQRYGNREPTDEEAREFMREWLESKGKSPEEIEKTLSGG